MPQGKYKLPEEEKKTGQYKIQSPSEIIESKTPEAVKKAATAVSPYVPAALGTAAGVGASMISPASAPAWLPGLISSGTMATIQNLLEPKSQNLGKDIAVDTAIDEVGGRVISGLAKGTGIVGSGVIGALFPKIADKFKLSNIDQNLLKLKPTASQLTESKFLRWLEDSFSPTAKGKALQRSADLSTNEAEKLVKSLTGRSDISLITPVKQATNISRDLEASFDLSKFESNLRGAGAKFIAKANKVTDPFTGEIVEGPIIPNKLLLEARSLKEHINKSDIKPDPNSPLVKALDAIISNNEIVDPVTNTISPKMRNFGDLWETKQAIDNIAYNHPKSQVDFVDTRFRKLAQAINEDIDASIPSWSIDGAKATQLWNESKKIVAKRNELFDKGPIEKLLNDEHGQVTAINKLIDDPKELRRAVISGHLQIPNQGKFKYITQNTRKDLQGYELSRIINNAKIVDDKKNITFDAKALMDQFADPNKQESYRILFSKQNRADIEQFFKNISQVSDKNKLGMSNYWMLRLGGEGLNLGGNLAMSMISGSLPKGGTGTAIIGATLGLNQLGKLLTNPASARLMVSLAQNGPLNMSVGAAGRIIAHVLRNTPISLQSQDGSVVEGKLNSEGKFVIPLNSEEKK